MLALAASQSADLHVTLAALVVGVVVGGFGHLVRARWMIVLGIAIIGIASVLFSFVLRPGAG